MSQERGSAEIRVIPLLQSTCMTEGREGCGRLRSRGLLVLLWRTHCHLGEAVWMSFSSWMEASGVLQFLSLPVYYLELSLFSSKDFGSCLVKFCVSDCSPVCFCCIVPGVVDVVEKEHKSSFGGN